MKLLRNISVFVIALAMLVLGALFAVQNDAPVPLDLLVVSLPPRSIALWVLLAFALGGVLGMLTLLGINLRLRTALHTANRKLARALDAESVPAAAEGGADSNADDDTANNSTDKEPGT